MTGIAYRPDPPTNAVDAMILAGSGPEPEFDAVMSDFLTAGYHELKGRCERGGLREFASLGQRVPCGAFPAIPRLSGREASHHQRGQPGAG